MCVKRLFLLILPNQFKMLLILLNKSILNESIIILELKVQKITILKNDNSLTDNIKIDINYLR